MRILQTQVDAKNPESVAYKVDEITKVVNEFIEFGDPQDPNDVLSTTRAGSTAVGHNGTVGNIKGSWVDVALTTAGLSTVICIHNLYLDEAATWTVPVSGQPNCMWTVFGWMHDGDSDSNGRPTNNVFYVGDTVALNQITLRFDTTLLGGSLTIDGDHPMVCKMFFTRGTRL